MLAAEMMYPPVLGIKEPTLEPTLVDAVTRLRVLMNELPDTDNDLDTTLTRLAYENFINLLETII